MKTMFRSKFRSSYFYCMLLIQLLCLQTVLAQTKQSAKYLNQRLSTEERVADLVGKLSLNQKIKLLMYTSLAIDSANIKIPAYNWWNECLHGVARAGKATVFPQTIGLAATWNNDLVFNVANSISDEARAKYNYFQSIDKKGIYRGLNFWTPNINIFRDPRWGRGMETYGEDPYLTGQLASSFIKGIQGNDPKYFKAIATVKHFAIHSGPEETRHSFNAEVSDHDLYETYTPAFKTCIQDAKVYSLMCAYNRFRGTPCCGSSFLLTDLLRNTWGFKGFIVTDCGAIDDFFTKNAHETVSTPEEASAMAIKAGVDLECGSIFNSLDVAVAKGLLAEKDLDVAIGRLFTARFKLGFFDTPESNRYNKIPYSVVESKEHTQLALTAAQESMVLLKNNNNLLPLKSTIKNIAVIGPSANDHVSVLANYHGYPSKSPITPLEGIKEKFRTATISYAVGAKYTDEVPMMNVIENKYLFTDKSLKKNGLVAKYYRNQLFEGVPAITRTDAKIDFYWIENLPAPTFDREKFSVSWEGYIKPAKSGSYSIGLTGFDNYKLYINDSLVIKESATHEPNSLYKTMKLDKNKAYKIKVLFQSKNSAPHLQLIWEQPNQNLRAEALAIAAKADVVVLCVGLNPRLEGEEMPLKVEGFNKGDRTTVALPKSQSDLIKAIKNLGKPIILVLTNGSALGVNWENDNVDAILESWYGGQKAGTAIANILAGSYNPSGRLPITFYKSVDQLPPFEDYNMKNRTYRYFTGEPLYKFGYGLSYTNFSYKDVTLRPTYATGEDISFSVVVKNDGNYDGAEVVQLYLSKLDKTPEDANLSLKSFKKIFLKKGESKTVEFKLSPRDFSSVIGSKRVIMPGLFSVSVGGKQPDDKTGNNIVTKQTALTGSPISLSL